MVTDRITTSIYEKRKYSTLQRQSQEVFCRKTCSLEFREIHTETHDVAESLF